MSPRHLIVFVGAAWFALVASVGFPLLLDLFGGFVPTFAWIELVILTGLKDFGLSAAVAGVIVSQRVVTSTPVRSLVLGVLWVLLTVVFAGVVLTFMAVPANAYGMLFFYLFGAIRGLFAHYLVELKGTPLVLGALAAIAFRALCRSNKVRAIER